MIGLFDSGIGGLTVLKSLKTLVPEQDYVYLGDTARLPYGTKSPEIIRRYTQQNIQFLKKQGVHTVISACHSASSSILIYNIQDAKVPVYNVIEPSCHEALLKSKNKKIGLMATQATVDGGQYKKLINSPFELFSQPCPLLVPLVESGWLDDSVTDQVIARYTKPLIAAGVDVIILGCTHFPLLKEAIQKNVGPGVTLVDPGEILAQKIERQKIKDTSSSLKIFLTDNSPHFVKMAEQILPQLKLEITQVDLDPV